MTCPDLTSLYLTSSFQRRWQHRQDQPHQQRPPSRSKLSGLSCYEPKDKDVHYNHNIVCMIYDNHKIIFSISRRVAMTSALHLIHPLYFLLSFTDILLSVYRITWCWIQGVSITDLLSHSVRPPNLKNGRICRSFDLLLWFVAKMIVVLHYKCLFMVLFWLF